MLHVFFDTNIFYTDPFWKTNYHSTLLKLSKKKMITIYLSEVVVKELRHNFEKQLRDISDNISKDLGKLDKLGIKVSNWSLPNLDLTAKLCDFDWFYQSLEKYQNVVILKPSNELLPIIIDRAVKREKPFSEKKTELKDAVIWLTYAHFVNQNLVDEKCFLITKNISDFGYPKEERFFVDKDLIKDCDKFTLCNDISLFLSENNAYFEKPKIDFLEWLEKQVITDETIWNLINSQEGYGELVKTEIKDMNIFDFMGEEIDYSAELVYSTTYNNIGGVDEIKELIIHGCDDPNVEVFEDYAIISGNLYCSIKAELYSEEENIYDSRYVPFSAETEGELLVGFSFLATKNDGICNFEITKIHSEGMKGLSIKAPKEY